MKLKPTKLAKRTVIPKEEPAKKTETKKANKKDNKLPPDGYTPMFEPTRILIREVRKPDGSSIKQYLEVSVKRFDDDEALPFVWCSMYQESPKYTGYLKGKTIYLPLERLYTFIDTLTEVSEECDRRKIEY